MCRNAPQKKAVQKCYPQYRGKLALKRERCQIEELFGMGRYSYDAQNTAKKSLSKRSRTELFPKRILYKNAAHFLDRKSS